MIRNRDGYSMLEMLTCALLVTIIMNFACITYFQTVTVLGTVHKRLDDLQCVELALTDLKADAARAVDASYTGSGAVFTFADGTRAAYEFSDGALARNGVAYYPTLQDFRAEKLPGRLVHVDLTLRRHGRMKNTIISAVIYARNLNDRNI